MPWRYLCPRRADWLRGRPRETVATWAQSMQRAQSLAARGRWLEAIPHAGCAMEAAQLMVSDARCCDAGWLRRWHAARALVSMAVAGSRGAGTGSEGQRRRTIH